MTPGAAALCEGVIWHRRNRPAINEFTYPVSMVWIDPDHPEELTDRHPWWSSSGRAPVRFRRSDYGAKTTGSLAGHLRQVVAEALGRQPTGPVRLLTQLRRWGWMFNPISLALFWDDGPDRPVAAVAEVTNTPWNERTQYPVALEPLGPDRWGTAFPKAMHVSPFLGMDYRYELTVTDADPAVALRIDVCGGDATPIVETELRVVRTEPTKPALTRSLLRQPVAAHRVSAGIHWQAARLAAKRVRFVPHPDKSPGPKEMTR